jgi:hypothetical protein
MRLLAALGVAALALGQTSTLPFVRTRIEGLDLDRPCLYWNAGELTFHQAQGGGATPAYQQAVSRSWARWQELFRSCGNLTLLEGAADAPRWAGYDERAGARNVNTVLFRDKLCSGRVPGGCTPDSDCGNLNDCWEFSSTIIALTTNSYEPQTGLIIKTDIEMNGASFAFTTVDEPACVRTGPRQPCVCSPQGSSCVLTDVENTMVHEVGHSLGLDHTDAVGSTMESRAEPGETSKRVIDSGSAHFVCSVYAQGAPTRTCRVFPLEGGEALGQAGGATGCGAVGGGAAGLAVLAAGLLRRRRRR